MDSQVDVRLLGHLEVEVSGERVRFEGVNQRRLFAVLALRAPETVSADGLVEAVWSDHPPAGAVPAVQKQISRLRQRIRNQLYGIRQTSKLAGLLDTCDLAPHSWMRKSRSAPEKRQIRHVRRSDRRC